MKKIIWKTVIVQQRQRKKEKWMCLLNEQNSLKICHCAMKAKKERKKRDFLFFLPFFSPSKLPRDFFCCNPSKKDSLDKIKTSQSIWKEFLKTISQPTHQSKMQVAIFISKNPIELCFLQAIFFYSGKNLRWQKKKSICKCEEILPFAMGRLSFSMFIS